MPSLTSQHATDLLASTSFDAKTHLGLDLWQKTSVCPEFNTEAETWNAMFESVNGLTTEQREQIFCKEDEKNCPRTNADDDMINYPNPVMRDVCRLNRVAPMFVTEND